MNSPQCTRVFGMNNWLTDWLTDWCVCLCVCVCVCVYVISATGYWSKRAKVALLCHWLFKVNIDPVHDSNKRPVAKIPPTRRSFTRPPYSHVNWRHICSTHTHTHKRPNHKHWSAESGSIFSVIWLRIRMCVMRRLHIILTQLTVMNCQIKDHPLLTPSPYRQIIYLFKSELAY